MMNWDELEAQARQDEIDLLEEYGSDWLDDPQPTSAMAAYKFPDRQTAWRFLRDCEEAGLVACCTGLKPCTIDVTVQTTLDRICADGIAIETREIATALKELTR